MIPPAGCVLPVFCDHGRRAQAADAAEATDTFPKLTVVHATKLTEIILSSEMYSQLQKIKTRRHRRLHCGRKRPQFLMKCLQLAATPVGLVASVGLLSEFLEVKPT